MWQQCNGRFGWFATTKGLLLHIPVPSNYMISITELEFFFFGSSKTHPLQNHIQYRDIGWWLYPAFALHFHSLENCLGVSNSIPRVQTLPLTPWASLCPDPAQAQVQGTFWKLGFFKEREFSSLIPLFHAKGRPVLGMLVPERKLHPLSSQTVSPVRLSSAKSSA